MSLGFLSHKSIDLAASRVEIACMGDGKVPADFDGHNATLAECRT